MGSAAIRRVQAVRLMRRVGYLPGSLPYSARAQLEGARHNGEVEKGSARLVSLDNLRGLAILGMIFSGVLPWSSLPAWMYHAQTPPPSRAFDPSVPGITWVDMVFPFFLFAMGAAIPLSKAQSPWWQPLARGLLLAVFAIVIQHIRPNTLSESPDATTWWLGLVGFLLVLGMYVRSPKSWPTWAPVTLKAAAWIGMAIFLAQARYPSDTMPGFAKERSDIILLVLAGVYTLGSYIWRATRDSWEVRCAVIAALAAFRLSTTVEGSWAWQVWTWDGVAWLFQPKFAGYLLLVLPGTIAGDWYVRRQAPAEESSKPQTPAWIAGALAWLSFAVVVSALVAFFQRANPMIPAVVAAIPLTLATRSRSPDLALIRWGFLWLLLGCLLEPYEGGIKKDPYTLSYLLGTAGLAVFALVWLAAVPERGFRWLQDVGANPLLAYAAVTNLVPSVWGLAFSPWVNQFGGSLPVGMSIAVGKTALLAVFLSIFARLRVTMRA